jgi:hypothetical protein
LLAVNFGHFFFVGSKPECAARIIFDIDGKLRNELLPESAREVGEGELRLGIVHDDNVAHSSGRSAPCDWTAIENKDLQAGAGAFSGASGTDDSSADDNEVEGFGHGIVKALKRQNEEKVW